MRAGGPACELAGGWKAGEPTWFGGKGLLSIVRSFAAVLCSDLNGMAKWRSFQTEENIENAKFSEDHEHDVASICK